MSGRVDPERAMVFGRNRLGAALLESLRSTLTVDSWKNVRREPKTRVVGPDDLDLGSLDAVRTAVNEFEPTVVVITLGMEEAELSLELPNFKAGGVADAAMFIAWSASTLGARVLFFSRSWVFDGLAGRPYTEGDLVAADGVSPLGRTLIEAERGVATAEAQALVLRADWIYDGETPGFQRLVAMARDGVTTEPIYGDWSGVPTPLSMVVYMATRALEADLSGIFHVAPAGHCTLWECAMSIYEHIDARAVPPVRNSSWDTLRVPLDGSALAAVLDVPHEHWTEPLKRLMPEPEE